MSSTFHFPGAVGLTHLRVYTSTGIDGLVGGSPHMHLASAEAYVPTAGEGEALTLSTEGPGSHRLLPGRVVWFEPGVIHRLVNSGGDLEILAIMQNAGLPEAGDAVFTFPDEIMENQVAYDRAAALPDGPPEARFQAAQRRRDLAIEGYNALLAKPDVAAALDRFYAQAIARKQHLFAQWSELLRSGVEAEAHLTRQRLAAIAAGKTDLLRVARQAATSEEEDTHPGVGMCGMLQQFAPTSR